jgi:glycosyltransferase involved in cell wall biosynthesis
LAQDFSRFDVVHAMGDNHLLRTRTPVLRTLSGSALAEAMNARRVRTCAMQLSIYPFELIGAARADQAVGISKATNAHFPGVDIIVPSAVDLEAFHPGAARSPHPSILTVGHRLRDRKRLDLLLAAFRVGVRPLVPDAELWMVCDDPIDEPSVRSYSGLITDELADLYRRAWIFCLPSAYEGFGRPYVEALASGTPVVATPNAGACEVLAGGQYGVLTTPDQLASTLVALIRAPARRARLARAGLGRAEDFSWAQTIVAYETIYEALAAGRKQRGTEVERAS